MIEIIKTLRAIKTLKFLIKIFNYLMVAQLHSRGMKKLTNKF